MLSTQSSSIICMCPYPKKCTQLGKMHTVGENAHGWGKCTQLGKCTQPGEMHTAGGNTHSWGKCTQLGKMHTAGENMKYIIMIEVSKWIGILATSHNFEDGEK